MTAAVLAADEDPLLVTVALSERVRALHELGEIAEARRLWELVEARLPAVATGDPSFVHRITLVGADLAQFGAGGIERSLEILRTAAALLRAAGDAESSHLIAWDAVRRLGFAGRHRDLLTAITSLGDPPATFQLELAVPWALAEALDGSPRSAADRLAHSLERLDREPQSPPLVEQGLQGAFALVSVWGGEPDRVNFPPPRDPLLGSAHALFSAALAIARLDWVQADVHMTTALRMREEADFTGLLNVVRVLAAQVAAARGDTATAREHLRARDVSDERASATTRADLDYRAALTRIALGDNPKIALDAIAERVDRDELALPALWLDHARGVYGLPRASDRAFVDRLDQGAPAIAARLDQLQALDGESAAAKRRTLASAAHAGVWIPTSLPSAGLTARQREVAALLVQGMTNRDIADRLQLSVRTVDSHVAATMRRLGASTRAEATEALRSISAQSPDAVVR
ncbi:MAG TPA: helix-turn-helix transcriptional regulator [Microcella sp.]|nr:helix-turn-helix transcriptional regulator [Microcella sp.]